MINRGLDSILHISIKVFKPKFFFDLIIFNPCLTIALFNPVKGTTSQTVPSDTRSRKFKSLGSSILLSINQFFSLNVLFKPTRNINETPAAHRYFKLEVSSIRLGLIIE